MASQELYEIIDGKKQDVHLHGPILDNPAAERAVARATAARLMAKGFTRAQVERLYGPESVTPDAPTE